MTICSAFLAALALVCYAARVLRPTIITTIITTFMLFVAVLLPPADSVADRPAATAVAQHTSARRLRKRIGKLLARSPLRGVTTGIVVADAASGEEWFRLRADKSLNPASTLKLFTSAATLDRLGPDHHFSTWIAVDGDTAYLGGNGDPLLTTEDLRGLVARAEESIRDGGPIRRIAVDTSAFAGGVLPPGFGKKKTDASYRAATGAVALDLGATRITVKPGREGKPPRVSVSPPGSYVVIDNKARTVSGKGSTIRVTLQPKGTRSLAVITGKIGRRKKKGTSVRRRVEHPPMAAGYAFRALLKRAGVRVSSRTPIVMEATPAGARRLALHQSPPMHKILEEMNKHSNNFIAEMTLRAIGAAATRPGTWKSGKSAVNAFLAKRVGLPSGYRYNNGSGLYDGGRFSPRQVVRLLQYMNAHKHRDAYRDSLAVAGRSGTLSQRLKGANYAGRVIGKTGTLNSVSALSGYARNRGGRLLTFSIIMNNTHKATHQMRQIQDRICALIVESR
ncbi:MAG: D-alanyl-D-alanine carboxypeptidase/D-alanyl-D-alanine-endopeptidase (penicillin-binding protein 4) [Myxococcota bacterium]|jgi:D-alanyl-D-alanine carboxypeptidase/D-alanyl-D-alanine-endopeptidase (penicillin-binding protein 4)